MKNLIVIIYLIGVAYSSEYRLTCSDGPLNIAYINGVRTSEDKAIDDATRISALIELSVVDENGFSFIGTSSTLPGQKPALYNSTEGLRSDIAASAYFKIREQVTSSGGNISAVDLIYGRLFRKPILFGKAMYALGLDPRPIMDALVKPLLPTTIHDLNKFSRFLLPQATLGKKILIVSHSEGTMYANAVLDEIGNYPVYNQLKKNVFASVMLGPATSLLPKNSRHEKYGTYILNSTDLAVQGVSGLASNMRISPSAQTQWDWSGHGLREIYLNENLMANVDGKDGSMVTHFVHKLRTTVSQMVSNREECCGMGDRGRIWFNDPECNSPACLGGYISSEVKISKDKNLQLQLGKDSLVCGKAYIGYDLDGKQVKSNIEIIGDSYINGNVSIGGKTKVENSTVENLTSTYTKIYSQDDIIISGESYITGPAFIEGQVTLSGMDIDGFVDIEDAVLLDSNIKGPATIGLTKKEAQGISIRKHPDCVGHPYLWGNSRVEGSSINIETCGEIKSSKVLGHIAMTGKVILDDVELNGEEYDSTKEPMRIYADNDTGIVIGVNSSIANRPLIEGSLNLLDGATIIDNGSYQGSKVDISNGDQLVSTLAGGLFQGNNEIKGSYVIETSLKDVIVEGAFVEFGPQNWQTIFLNAASTIGDGASLKGFVNVRNGGTLGEGAIVDGRIVGGHAGVLIDDASYLGAGKKIQGAVLLNAGTTVTNSNINGSEVNPNNNAITHLDGTTMSNSTISNGIGRISESTVTGATFSGSQYLVFNATLNGTTVVGNAYLCNTTYGATLYGAGFNCAVDPPLVGPKPDLSKSFKKDVQQMIKAQRNGYLARQRHKEIFGTD